MAVISAPVANRRRFRRRRGLLAGLVLVWLALGALRAPSVASDHFLAIEGPRHVSGLETTAIPAVPPFWVVQVRATVTEPSGASYGAVVITVIEPLTGFTLDFGRG